MCFRLNDDDDKAAKVGVIETTRVPTAYHRPANPNIKFWDLPGLGTPNYPNMEAYCKKVKLEKYHAFLIFSANRFTENDLKLATKIKSIDRKFFFICTKIDENVRSEKRKGTFNEDEMLEEIRSYCLENLVDQLRNEKDIFLISNHYPAKWDFKRLTHAILHELCSRESLPNGRQVTGKWGCFHVQ